MNRCLFFRLWPSLSCTTPQRDDTSRMFTYFPRRWVRICVYWTLTGTSECYSFSMVMQLSEISQYLIQLFTADTDHLVLIVLVCVCIFVWLNHTGALQMSMLPVCIWPPLRPTWQSLPMNRQNTWAWTRMALLNPTITGTTVQTLTSECNRITEKTMKQ